MSKIHKEYTDYVLLALRDINPYHTSKEAHAWATGFLAAYLASKLKEDPIAFRQFKLAVNKHRARKGLRNI